MRDDPPPLELATSTMHHAAEELRVVSRTIAHLDESDLSNAVHGIADRIEAMATLCNELGAGGSR